MTDGILARVLAAIRQGLRRVISGRNPQSTLGNMYSEKFRAIMPFILGHETVFEHGHDGDYKFAVAEDVPGDDGGVTKFGIDQTDHPSVDVRNLTLQGAMDIYWTEWNEHRCEEVPDKYSSVFFDIWVNGGPAVRMLQEAVRVEVDGFLGPLTLAACAAMGDFGVIRYLMRRRLYYVTLADEHENDKQFLAGWLNRNADLATLVGVGPAYQRLC